jgi:hypothetical protein
MRLVIAALWLCGGLCRVYTFFKDRAYIGGLPTSEGNDELKRKHRRRFLWSLASVALGVWWALSHWFPSLNVRFK